jgi:hypothetical protein
MRARAALLVGSGTVSVVVVAGLLLASASCTARRRDGGGVASGASGASSAAGASAASGVPAGSEPCGKIACRIFPSAREAFATVLERKPLVLAIGEAHAQRGTESVVPATRRFAEELLPLLAGRASDLVVELLLPNAACAAKTREAAEQQKVVTEHQAPTDQNDFVTLANVASRLGIRPHALRPTCDDLARIAGAGPDAVLASLDVVTRLSREALESLLDANRAARDARLVVAYGGMMHNDVAPRAERAKWSFGPALVTRTGGRYVEVDLVVPELVRASPTWASLPWFGSFDARVHAAETRLLAPAEGSFVLVFPGIPPGG